MCRVHSPINSHPAGRILLPRRQLALKKRKKIHVKRWRNRRVEHRPVPKLQIETGDRGRVTPFTAVQAPREQVRVRERGDWSELGSRGWEYCVQLSTDTSHSPPPMNVFTEGEKIPPALREAPFVPVVSIGASRAAKAGPRHGDVHPRPPELLCEMLPPSQITNSL